MLCGTRIVIFITSFVWWIFVFFCFDMREATPYRWNCQKKKIVLCIIIIHALSCTHTHAHIGSFMPSTWWTKDLRNLSPLSSPAGRGATHRLQDWVGRKGYRSASSQRAPVKHLHDWHSHVGASAGDARRGAGGGGERRWPLPHTTHVLLRQGSGVSTNYRCTENTSWEWGPTLILRTMY